MDIHTFAREILHGSEGKTVTIPSAVLVDDERIPMTLTIKRSDASGVYPAMSSAQGDIGWRVPDFRRSRST